MKRRDVLRLTGAAALATGLEACLPTQTTTPTSAPSADVPQRAGRFDLGTFEGPEIVLDTSRYPKMYKEAPELAALVQQGKLPPVAERIGQDPIVVRPVHAIGRYGGILRKVVIGGPGGDLTSQRFMTGPGSLLFADPLIRRVRPNIARGYEASADGKVLTVRLRRGMRWSDGAPFTADDILFWFEDIYNYEPIHAGDSPDLLIGGKKVIIEKVDQYTVRFTSPVPNSLIVDIIATPITDVGGPLFRGQLGRGGYAPKHYLSKFHAKYLGEVAATTQATAAKFNSWVAYFNSRSDFRVNPDLPVLAPWVVRVPLTDSDAYVLERNPYSVWVDTEGNQLPYIGTVRHSVLLNTEVAVLRATAGELDYQEALFAVGKLPVLVDSQDRGGYRVHLDLEQTSVGIALNLAYEADAEIGALLRTVDFRRAISMGIDRGQINEAIFLGTGQPSSAAPADDNKYFPGTEWRSKWHTLDVALANQLLDEIGVTQKDPEGYRLRRDGKGRLRLEFLAVDRITDFNAIAEMIRQQWQKIGIDLSVVPTASALAQQRIQANQAQLTGNTVGAEDAFLSSGMLTPAGAGGFNAIIGVPYTQWWSSGGRAGKEPFAEMKRALELYDLGRLAATEAERIRIGQELTQIHVDQVFSIGIVGQGLTGGIRIAKKTLGNVPGRTANVTSLFSPSVGSLPQTFYFK